MKSAAGEVPGASARPVSWEMEPLSHVCLKMHLWKHGGTTTNMQVVKYPGRSFGSPGCKLTGCCICVCLSRLRSARLRSAPLGSRKSWCWNVALMTRFPKPSCDLYSQGLTAFYSLTWNTSGFTGCTVKGSLSKLTHGFTYNFSYDFNRLNINRKCRLCKNEVKTLVVRFIKHPPNQFQLPNASCCWKPPSVVHII